MVGTAMLAAGSGGGAVDGPAGGRVRPDAVGVAPVVVPLSPAVGSSSASGHSRNVRTAATRTSTSPAASATRRPRPDPPFGGGPTGGTCQPGLPGGPCHPGPGG